MFYANPTIKFARIAYRGMWAALGIEFNFPVSHNWMTVSPVNFAMTREPDGGASVWAGSIDRPYGMEWRVQLTLRPGRAYLEQKTTLYNRDDARHRFYWWTNAGVQVWDDSRILYPMEFTAAHGFADIDTWPVNPEAVLNLKPQVVSAGAVTIEAILNVTRELPDASLSVLAGARTVASARESLSPKNTFRKTFSGLAANTIYTVELRDSSGELLLRQTERKYDFVSH